jgi:hypothetical protein
VSIDFAYAQARVQARLGQRLAEEGWRLLESSLGAPQYLTSVRGTSLAPRVQQFTPAASPHAIDRSLRAEWRAEVAATCRWVPDRWRDAVDWTTWIPYLDAVAYLLRDGPVLDWMRDDPVLADVAIADPESRRLAIDASPFAVLARDGAEAALRERWLARWRSLWPSTSTAEASGLRRFAAGLEEFGDTSRRSDATPRDRAEARAHLAFRAARMLRQQDQQPVIVFCHLLLVALDLLRLRDGLLRRALFSDARPEMAA